MQMTRNQKWYSENKEYFVTYRQNNREKIKQQSKRWRLANPEKVKKMNKIKYERSKALKEPKPIKDIEKTFEELVSEAKGIKTRFKVLEAYLTKKD